MKSLRNILSNKGLQATGLSLSLYLFSGCTESSQSTPESSQSTPKQSDVTPERSDVQSQNPYYFTNLGDIGRAPGFMDKYNGIAVGDMDGDGDNDIIVLRDKGNMFIYENRIPQKGKTNLTDKLER